MARREGLWGRSGMVQATAGIAGGPPLAHFTTRAARGTTAGSQSLSERKLNLHPHQPQPLAVRRHIRECDTAPGRAQLYKHLTRQWSAFRVLQLQAVE